MRFLDRIKFKLTGRSVPVMKVTDEDIMGRVEAVQLISSAKDRENSVLETWDGKGFEKDKDNPPITVTDDKGNTTRWWVSKGGRSISLYSRISAFPNKEKLIGAVSNMDDFAEALQIKPTMREKVMFMIIGILMGVFIVQPMLATFMS